jgi:hypothetical protein
VKNSVPIPSPAAPGRLCSVSSMNRHSDGDSPSLAAVSLKISGAGFRRPIFVDCEARGTRPVHGVLTEFGAVHCDTRETFYGRLFEATLLGRPQPRLERHTGLEAAAKDGP